MCGIVGFFARESIPNISVIDKLLANSELRGTDGFGIWIGRKNDWKIRKYVDKYSECRQDVLLFINEHLKIGNLLLAISRAAPETEEKTTSNNMQPIINAECVLVHNGSITYSVYKKFVDAGFKFNTHIDSEAIIASYIYHNKNMKNAMEYISGGVSAMLYDMVTDRLFLMNDFKPIAHCHVRGVGYFVSSDNDALGDIVSQITGSSRDGMNMWEDWYHHYLTGNYIRSFDLDSCFMRQEKYSPRYIIGTMWDSNYNPDGSKRRELENV